ncbi:MAG: MEDS domain-containing protein [Verrucomicrobiales bacterium]
MKALHDRLTANGVDTDFVCSGDQYMPLDAEQVLSKFMVKGWPDDRLFSEVVTGLLKRARKGGRRVRAFGEMVAVLWAQGHNGATVRLEHLWHSLCRTEEFSLFCAYPRSGFTQNADESIREICATHSRVVHGLPLQVV